MADTAARLTDEVLPRVPVRQWVLSLPYEIRYRLAWDGDLMSVVLAVFLRVVYGWYRRQARDEGHEGVRCGSVTFVQRFGSALNVNPHFHVLVPDGVFVEGPHGVLAPNAADRDRIVPGPQEAPTEGCSHAEQPSAPQPVYRLSWARLLARVFRVDVTECPVCGGKMKIIAALTEPVAIRKSLHGVGLASRPPPIAPSRPRPQTEFEYAG